MAQSYYRPFDWASANTNASGDVDRPQRPSASQVSQGWKGGEALDASDLNWLFDIAGLLSTTALPYDDLAQMVDDLSAGQAAICTEDTDFDNRPGTAHTSVASGFDVSRVLSNGKLVVWHGGLSSTVVIDDRDLAESGSGGSPTTYTIQTTPMSNFRGLAINSTVGVIVYDDGTDTYVECFNLSDGSAAWAATVSGSAQGYDVCVDNTRAYVVHANDASSNNLTAYTLSSGSVAHTYDHGAALTSCCVSEGRLFVTGAAGTGSFNTRALRASDLADTATAGAEAYAWNATLASVAATEGGKLVSDGRRLYVALPSTATDELVVLGAADGVEMASRDIADLSSASPQGEIVSMSVDHELLFVAVDNAGSPEEGAVFCLDKVDLSMRWAYGTDVTATGDFRGYSGICSDGAAVFVGGRSNTPDASLDRLYRGNTPTRMIRPADDASAPRYPWMTLQPG